VDGTGLGLDVEIAADAVLTNEASRAGDITVKTGWLTLTGGAAFTSNASSATNRGGGNVTITATDVLVISGSSVVISIGPVTLTAPTVRIESGTIGNPTFGGSGAADITIEAGQLTLTDDALITSSTASAGRGGDIRIQVDRVTLTGGATIRSQTFGIGASGTGQGGRITITATDVVAIAGPNSGLFTGTQSRGLGGDITLHAREFRLSDGATISATSSGAGDAGRITITATERFRSDRSTITARATQANGGEIVLRAGQGVQLWDNSTITASIEGGPATVGGNLTITAPFVVLEGSPGSQGGQIIARATEGMGGRISITTPALLAEPTPADPTGLSRVSASSERGISGLVDIQAPVTMLSGAIAPLPQAFVNVAALLPVRCAARMSGGAYSSLVLGGREGLPSDPSGLLPSPLVLDDRLVAEPAGTKKDGRQTPSAHGALLAAEQKSFPRLRGTYPVRAAAAPLDQRCSY